MTRRGEGEANKKIVVEVMRLAMGGWMEWLVGQLRPAMIFGSRMNHKRVEGSNLEEHMFLL